MATKAELEQCIAQLERQRDTALAQAEDYRANAEAVIIPLNVELAAAVRRQAQLREALAAAAEKVGVLYAMYTAGTAFWNDEDGELIVDAVWESRLIEADAVLSRALTATATDSIRRKPMGRSRELMTNEEYWRERAGKSEQALAERDARIAALTEALEPLVVYMERELPGHAGAIRGRAALTAMPTDK
jgi:hypothetical protein